MAVHKLSKFSTNTYILP